MSIIVLDPTPGSAPRAARLAPALATLAGTRIALLDNGKKNVRPFLDHVDALLRAEYDVREVLRLRKPSQNAPAPPALIAQLAQADAAVSAVGD